MSNIIVVGMQWGDEGKGKVVDLLCPAFDAVARYQGGNNAGHTVKFGDQHFSLHLIPSGILHEGMQCFLGNGMVVHPEAFLAEVRGLEERGVETRGRLWLSDRAQALLPIHPELDALREVSAGRAKIGTTAKGIGPAYEHKVSRFGVRIGDLGSEHLEARLAALLPRLEAECAAYDGRLESADLDRLMTFCREMHVALVDFVGDVGGSLQALVEDGKSILFEGAQGAMLDVDHGSYPYVTSSNSSAGGACVGTGIPPTAIDGALGVLKAYGTRVGEGPFPAELDGELLDHLRERGHEYGTTTGRPRRCGWLDLVVARYARRLNGIGSIALTKLDVLDEVEEIKVCVAYELDGERIDTVPADLHQLARVDPIYETLPGWQENTVGVLEFDDLPKQAREYVDFVEERVGAEIGLVSTGPKREETLVRRGGRLDGWVGGLEVV